MKRWVQDEESGQGLAEYALILIIVSVAAVISVGRIGTITGGYFDLAARKFLNQ